MNPPPLPPSLAHQLALARARGSDRPLLTMDGRSWSVADVDALAAGLRATLDHEGFEPGAPVLVMLDNHPLHVAVILALATSGRPWLPIGARQKAAQIRHCLGVLPTRHAIVEERFRSVLAGAGFEGRVLAPLSAEGSCPVPPIEPEPGALRAVMFTSGTTGPPKGVRVSEQMLAASGHFAGIAGAAGPAETFLLWEPLHHIGGAQMIGMALETGARLAMVERFAAGSFWRQVVETGATRLHYLGGILDILMRRPPSPCDRAHAVLRAFGAGARPLTWRAFEERFAIRLVEVYGMTEASSFTTLNEERMVGSIGRPLPWFDVALRDAAGRPADEGEIVVRERMPHLLTSGYVGAASPVVGGWLHTGDIARRDADGTLAFVGRLKDCMRVRGENVAAFEVEAVLAAHPAVAECAAVGVAAEIGEEDILVYVRATAPLDPADLLTWAEPHLSTWQMPRYVAFVDDFERTPSERVRKAALSRSVDGVWRRDGNSINYK